MPFLFSLRQIGIVDDADPALKTGKNSDNSAKAAASETRHIGVCRGG
jgi:hypothetical protein